MTKLLKIAKPAISVNLFLICLFSTGCADQYVWNNDLVKTAADMSGYYYLDDDNPAFDRITIEESFRLFEEEQDGVILYSRASCEFCNAAVPILNEAAKECHVRILYVDIEDPEFTDLSIPEQKYLVNHLIELVSSVLDDNNLLIPFVVGVKNGEITGSYQGLTDSINIMSYGENDKSALDAMKRIYTTIIHSVLD